MSQYQGRALERGARRAAATPMKPIAATRQRPRQRVSHLPRSETSANGSSTTPVTGVPAVNSSGQGGLLDVALDPDFSTAPWVYFSYSENGTGGSGTAADQLNGEAGDDTIVCTSDNNVPLGVPRVDAPRWPWRVSMTR